jgi:hypothetical protein
MSNKRIYERWNDVFWRSTDLSDNTPRFSLKDSKGYLYEYDGYSGGHKELDQIIQLLEKNGIEAQISGTDSPMNVSTFVYVYDFEDGGLEIYSGNYLFQAPGQGAYVIGFKAFRWLLDQLGIAQPRKFKNEATEE